MQIDEIEEVRAENIRVLNSTTYCHTQPIVAGDKSTSTDAKLLLKYTSNSTPPVSYCFHLWNLTSLELVNSKNFPKCSHSFSAVLKIFQTGLNFFQKFQGADPETSKRLREHSCCCQNIFSVCSSLKYLRNSTKYRKFPTVQLPNWNLPKVLRTFQRFLGHFRN